MLLSFLLPGTFLSPVTARAATACDPNDQYTPCISVAPTLGPAGTQVTVTGTGWIDWAQPGYDVSIGFDFAPGQYLASPVPGARAAPLQ
jgi:hypothetical protein